MIELKRERIEQILNEETAKKKDPDDILRSVYTRYMFYMRSISKILMH